MDAIDKLLIAGIGVGLVMAVFATKNCVSGLNDTPVSLENIRRGVKNGWYSCVLTRQDGVPAVELSGRLQDGTIYTDQYPISEEDYATLQSEGYPEK